MPFQTQIALGLAALFISWGTWTTVAIFAQRAEIAALKTEVGAVMHALEKHLDNPIIHESGLRHAEPRIIHLEHEVESLKDQLRRFP